MAGKLLLTLFIFLMAAARPWPAHPSGVMSPAVSQVFPVRGGESGVEIKPAGDPGRVVIVVLDYLQIRDLEGDPLPNLAGIMCSGAAALMNVNTGGGLTPESTHATIGSGSHMLGYRPPSGGFGAGERISGGTASDEYRRRVGFQPQEGSLVFLDIAGLYRINETLRHYVQPGALGKMVRQSGFRTAAIGNADVPEGPRRQIVSMVMDHRGVVDTGMVGREVTRPEKEFPGGFSTDYGVLLDTYSRLPSDVRLVAIDTGDLGRLQEARKYTSQEIWQAWRQETLKRIDGFLGDLFRRMDLKRDLLVLAVPTPGDDGSEKDRMSPVVFYGEGVAGGLLVSPSTRRPGIIMNIDIAPTVLNYLGITAADLFTGRPARVIPGRYGMGELSGMYRAMALTYQARPFLQKAYVLFQIFLLAVSLGFIFMKKRGKECLKPFFLAVMAVPLAYLLMPLIPPGGVPVMAAELILMAGALTLLTIRLHKRYGVDPFLLLCLATAAAITADLAAGSTLQKASILGYDPIAGARFYGLGNEYMGVLIGSTIIGTTALVAAAEKWRRPAIAATGVVYLAVAFLIASPQFGTNVGGTIAATSAFLVVFLLLCRVRFSWTAVFSAGLAVALVLLAMFFYDSSRPAASQSHIGRTAALLSSLGMGGLTDIIARKSEMNIMLIRYTIWSRVLLASLGMLVILFYRPIGVMEGIRNRHPYLYMGLIGVVAGSITAFLFNDSGVVAAATAMIFGAPPLVYLVLDQMEDA